MDYLMEILIPLMGDLQAMGFDVAVSGDTGYVKIGIITDIINMSEMAEVLQVIGNHVDHAPEDINYTFEHYNDDSKRLIWTIIIR